MSMRLRRIRCGRYHPQERTSMLTDQSKFLLLLACLAICLGTLFTSNSFHTTGDARLNPSARFCRVPRAALKACAAGDSTCTAKSQAFAKCEEAVQQAYRHVNMAGCPFEIQAVNRCEGEWCGKDSEPVVCKKECQVSREALEECAKGHVVRWFQKHGLDVDGTSAEAKVNKQDLKVKKDRDTAALEVSGSSQTSSLKE
jgi:hypothetical protein